MKKSAFHVLVFLFFSNFFSCLGCQKQSPSVPAELTDLSWQAVTILESLKRTALTFAWRYNHSRYDLSVPINSYCRTLTGCSDQAEKEVREHFIEGLIKETTKRFTVPTIETDGDIQILTIVGDVPDPAKRYSATLTQEAKTIEIWGRGLGKKTGILTGHKDSIVTVAASGQTLLAGTQKGAVFVWNPLIAELLQIIEPPASSSGPIQGLTCDGVLCHKMLNTSSPEGQTVTVDAFETGQAQQMRTYTLKGQIAGTAVLARDGTAFIVTGTKKKTRVFKKTGETPPYQAMNMIGSFTRQPIAIWATAGAFNGEGKFALAHKLAVTVGSSTDHRDACLCKTFDLSQHGSGNQMVKRVVAGGDSFYAVYEEQNGMQFVVKVNPVTGEHTKVFTHNGPLIDFTVTQPDKFWFANANRVYTEQNRNVFAGIDPKQLSLRHLYLLWVLVRVKNASLLTELAENKGQVGSLYRLLPTAIRNRLSQYV